MLILYFCTYTVLSSNGRYEATVFGAGHVKWSTWAPAGFLHDATKFKWNMPVVYIFYPLWNLDRRYWHADIQGPPPQNVP
jgi:hypothetical protein